MERQHKFAWIDNVAVLERSIAESEAELLTLHTQIEDDMDREDTFASDGQIMELASYMAESEAVLRTLRAQIEELKRNMGKLDCSLRDARKCREKYMRVETAQYSGNRNRDIREGEATLHCRRCEELSVALRELRIQLESANRHIEEPENQRGSANRRTAEFRSRVREEAATENEGLQNRLQETNNVIREREATHHCRGCEELSMAVSDVRLQRESEHGRITERENRVREVAATSNEGLQNRLQERDRDIRGREATFHCPRSEELCVADTELRLERESANERTTEHENSVREETSTWRGWWVQLLAEFRRLRLIVEFRA
jgi:hypothetical protein